jgi:hypothetical protein
MRITEYLKQHPAAGAGFFYADLPALLSRALRSGRYPPPLPPPPPRSVTTGIFPDSVTSFRLELAAFSRGYDRALWMPSADAAFLHLEPEAEEKPVLAAFRSVRGLYLQNVYFIDSFTAASLERFYSFANPRANALYQPDKKPLSAKALAVRNEIAAKALFYTAAHDTGRDSGEPRMERAAFYRQNSSPGSPLFPLMNNAYKTYVSNIPPEAVKAFEYIRKYRAQQLTGLRILSGDGIDATARKSLEYLSESNVSKPNPAESLSAFPAVFYAMSFASQLCREARGGREKIPAPAAGPAVSRPPGRRDPPGPPGAGEETPIDSLLGN